MANEFRFQYGRQWIDENDRSTFEGFIQFTFPVSYLRFLGNWNGGSLDGFLIFDTPVCLELVASKFLSLLSPRRKPNRFTEDILSEVHANPALRHYRVEEVPFVPFALVDGSMSNEESENPYNARSVLAFERERKGIYLLSSYRGSVIPVATSFSKWLAAANYVPLD
jgi:hypothetical protein